MTEKLLQFIWQYQYLNKQDLVTTEGEPVCISNPGQLNTHQGPDFFNGRVKIGQTEWAGHIEIHVKSSDWYKHQHQKDPGYGKVILHVVWIHDAMVQDENNQSIPVIVLQGRVSGLLQNQYERWMNSPKLIPCHAQLNSLKDIIWQHWLDRLLAERLLEKCSTVAVQVEKTEMHWEEVSWRMICTYFGGPVNKISFQQIAESLPLKILAKHKLVITQLEALLLGQAGFLHKNLTDSYPKMLFREYQFLQKKYQLRVINKPPVFLRMRPTEFPTIRLAQLAALLQNSTNLLGKLISTQTLQEAKKLFEVTANDYWNHHYQFDKTQETFQPKQTGKTLIDRVFLNAVIPVLFSYGHKQMDDKVRTKALQWLEQLPAENNQVTRIYAALGKKPVNASQSQAILTLKQEYCDAKRCLDCAVGNQLLKISQ